MNYDDILASIDNDLERKVFEALRRAAPEGLRREQLVAIAFGTSVRPGGLGNNSVMDRKVRLAIARLRKRMVPIVSSSARAGYRLDTSEEGRRRMMSDLRSRRDELDELLRRAAKFYAMPEEYRPAPVVRQDALL